MVKHGIVKFIVIAFLLGGMGLTLWTWASLSYVYSSGERVGYIQKFSRKGWFVKTWEGELLMVALPGTIPEKFQFTVRDDKVAQTIQGILGQRVILTYNEHRGVPTRFFGETSYFVKDVHIVEDPSQPQTFPVNRS